MPPHTSKTHISDFLQHPTVILACSFLICATVGGLLPEIPTYDEKRIIQIALLITSCLISIISLKNRALQQQLSYISITAFAITFLLATLSAITNDYKLISFLEIALAFSLILLIINFAKETSQKPLFSYQIIIGALAICITIHLVSFGSAITAQIALTGQINLSDPYLLLNYSNIRFLNQFQSWTLALCVLPLLIFKTASKPLKLFFFTTGSGWWFMLLYTQGRGTLVGITVAIIFVLIVFNKQSFAWVKLQLLSCLTAISVYLPMTYATSLFPKDESFIETHVLGLSLRDILWQRASELIQQSPWLGIGPANFSCEVDMVYAHPHNAPLQMLSEWGIPAALVMVILFVYAFFRWIKFCRSASPATKEQSHIHIALSSSLVTAATHSLVSGILVMPVSQIAMAIVIGSMLGTYRARHPLPTASLNLRITTALLAIITACTLLFAAHATYPSEPNLTHQRPLSTIWFLTSPRHWFYGKHCAAPIHQKILDKQYLFPSH